MRNSSWWGQSRSNVTIMTFSNYFHKQNRSPKPTLPWSVNIQNIREPGIAARWEEGEKFAKVKTFPWHFYISFLANHHTSKASLNIAVHWISLFSIHPKAKIQFTKRPSLNSLITLLKRLQSCHRGGTQWRTEQHHASLQDSSPLNQQCPLEWNRRWRRWWRWNTWPAPWHSHQASKSSLLPILHSQ